MPFATAEGVEVHYRTTGGTGDGDGTAGGAFAPVAFVGDAGYGAWQWGWQHRALTGRRRAVVFTYRGTGRSDAPPGPYALADLVADLRAVLDAAGTARPHLVGAGLGGLVALRATLGDLRPRSLTLLGTAASGANIEADRLRAPPSDPAAIEASLEAALSPGFRSAQPEVVEQIVAWRADEDAAPDAWAAQTAALEGVDLSDRLYEVSVPALVIHGGADPVWPAARGAALAEGLPRGSYVREDGARHLVGVERSRAVNDRFVGFLADVEA
jgi:pimeloyl-ACP methyl ester carboxylesterase